MRLTTCHEYKHILDHGKPALQGNPSRRYYGRPAAEYVADYFGGCLLMPKRLVTRAWFGGTQRTPELAALFDVSAVAMRVRLSQLGLAAAPYTREARNQSMRADCARRPGHRYERQLSAHWPLGPANSKSLLDALELDR